ncbi:MAG: DsbA family protein [Alphaproteobacteria bacterium]|jgi:2-hydroxychromene-2-carboxylate isomerase|nr:DsbA family protein [Alphaproteobacteria bacterium]MDP6517658.1 DsbA family protein [Alphaproteobacteria bacterium]
MTTKSIAIYIDFKSPYAYLAIAPSWDLARDFDVALDWRPYTLDIPNYLGNARVDEKGQVVEEDRTPHQWRRVRYAYMNARRYANLRGMTIRGTQKIWDSSVAAIGLLWARRQGAERAYMDRVYEPFWKRALDIEDRAVISAELAAAGADVAGFETFLDGEGRAEHDRIRADAEERGIFGVPSYILDDELYWGREHLALIRLRLAEQNLARAGAEVDVTYARR